MEEFTGSNKTFNSISRQLFKKGFAVKDGTHLGEDRYEFIEQGDKGGRLGCHNLYAILAWLKKDGSVEYKTKGIGSCCND